VHDLLNGARYTWRGRRNYVELDPDIQPAHIFLVCRWVTQTILSAWSRRGAISRPPLRAGTIEQIPEYRTL